MCEEDKQKCLLIIIGREREFDNGEFSMGVLECHGFVVSPWNELFCEGKVEMVFITSLITFFFR